MEIHSVCTELCAKVLDAKDRVNCNTTSRKNNQEEEEEEEDEKAQKQLPSIDKRATDKKLLDDLALLPSDSSIVATFAMTPERKPIKLPKRKPTSLPIICKVKSQQQFINMRRASHQDLNRLRYRNEDIPNSLMNRYFHHNHGEEQYSKKKLTNMLRPKIFLDLKIKGVRPLGRLVIQLFTDKCPSIVCELVRICTAENTESIKFTRFVSCMWLECKLALDNNYEEFKKPSFDIEYGMLNHGTGAGILSFSRCYISGSKYSNFTFGISVKPFNIQHGKRVAFGKVCRGLWMIDTILEYGLEHNKSINDVIVTKCGQWGKVHK